MRKLLGTALTLSLLVVAAADAQPRFRLKSTDIRPGATIGNAYVFNGMDCKGNNVSPELEWQGAPRGTKSYALTLYDPDAPTGSGWWHWVVYNIPGSANRLARSAGNSGGSLLPKGTAQGNGDVGTPGYQGPCPSKGDRPHRYVFSLYALDTDRLDLPAAATAAYVGFNIHSHQLGKATLTAMYGR